MLSKVWNPLSCPKKAGLPIVDFMEKGQKTPYYGKRVRNHVLKEYLNISASMDELSEIHGVLGSNTISDWLKKYGN